MGLPTHEEFAEIMAALHLVIRRLKRAVSHADEHLEAIEEGFDPRLRDMINEALSNIREQEEKDHRG